MIPGPIEFEPKVLRAMGVVTTSHVAPNFIETFGNSLDLMKQIWMAPGGQAFIVSGSGTLSMDMAAANLVERGDNVTFEAVLENVEERDHIDTTREDSPLRKAFDAIEIDEVLVTDVYAENGIREFLINVEPVIP